MARPLQGSPNFCIYCNGRMHFLNMVCKGPAYAFKKSKYKFELMEIITDVIYVLFNFGCLKPNAKIHLIDTMEQGPYDPVITPLSEIRISFSSLDKRGREG